MKRQWMNDDYDDYLEPPTEPRYGVLMERIETIHEWATSNGYDDTLTLERVDRDGHYEPNNCTWVSYKAQARNTVQNNLLTYKGKTMPLIEWVEKTGIKYSTLRSRVFVYGWSVERAIETPVRNEGAQ